MRKSKTKASAESAAATWKVWEAAKVAGCGQHSIREGVRANTIPHIRFGRNILIPKVAFLRWLESCGSAR